MRFSDVSGVTMRSVDVDGLDIDSHDLFFGSLVVNGVDVVPLVDAELNRQFPGRELQKAQTPEGLREGWVAVQSAWQTTVDGHAAGPGRRPRRGRVVVGPDPAAPHPGDRRLAARRDPARCRSRSTRSARSSPVPPRWASTCRSSASTRRPYDEILAVRAERQQLVTDFLATATAGAACRGTRQPLGRRRLAPDCRRLHPGDPRGGVGTPALHPTRPRPAGLSQSSRAAVAGRPPTGRDRPSGGLQSPSRAGPRCGRRTSRTSDRQAPHPSRHRNRRRPAASPAAVAEPPGPLDQAVVASRSRSRTQNPWWAHSSFSTVPRHCRTRRPFAYGGHRPSSGTGAVWASCCGVTPASHVSISDACRSRTASTSSRLGRAARSRPSCSAREHRADPHRRERLGQPEDATPEPRVVDEDQVAQRLDHRPLTVHAAMLAPLGHRPHPLDGLCPVIPSCRHASAQVGRVVGPDQQSHRRRRSSSASTYAHHLDPVDHQVGDQAVDLGVLHHHADQAGPAEVALAELGTGQVLVIETSHANSL